LLLIAAAAIGIRVDHNQHGRYFWEPKPADTPAAVPAQTPPAPAK
jgi:hypothetical protein